MQIRTSANARFSENRRSEAKFRDRADVCFWPTAALRVNGLAFMHGFRNMRMSPSGCRKQTLRPSLNECSLTAAYGEKSGHEGSRAEPSSGRFHLISGHIWA